MNKYQILGLLVILMGSGTILAQENSEMDHSQMDHAKMMHAKVETEQSEGVVLTVTEGWIRLTPPVAKNSAAYFILTNSSGKALTINSVSTQIAQSATMHDVEINMSMVRMVDLESLTLAAGEVVVFAPGGKHLMLVNLTEKLEADKQVEVVFNLASGETVSSMMKIMRSNNMKASEHKHH